MNVKNIILKQIALFSIISIFEKDYRVFQSTVYLDFFFSCVFKRKNLLKKEIEYFMLFKMLKECKMIIFQSDFKKTAIENCSNFHFSLLRESC